MKRASAILHLLFLYEKVLGELPKEVVILSDQRESKDLRIIDSAKQKFSAKILRFRIFDAPLRMTGTFVNCEMSIVF